MYDAVVPQSWRDPTQKSLAENLPEPQLISHLMPWLPGALPPPDGLLDACCCIFCNESAEDSAALLAHSIAEHFTAQLAESLSAVLSGLPPYHCPRCEFCTSSNKADGGEQQQLFYHLAECHKETVKDNSPEIAFDNSSLLQLEAAVAPHKSVDLLIKEECQDLPDVKEEARRRRRMMILSPGPHSTESPCYM